MDPTFIQPFMLHESYPNRTAAARMRFRTLSPWLGLVLLGAWVGWPDQTLLLIPAAAAFGVAVTGPLSRGRTVLVAMAVLAITAGFSHAWRMDRIQSEWDRLWAAREGRIEAQLERTFARLLEEGGEGVDRLVAASATVGLVGREGLLIRRTIVPMTYYVVFAGVLGMLFAYVIFPDAF